MTNVVYSKPMCTYCDKAKHLLKTAGIEFKEMLIGRDLDRETLLEEFEANGMPQPRSVPQIILNGKYVGGYNELVKYVEEHGMEGLKQ
tara:strand:+ start:17444 stop:17707 length:264 start_codon:yes stop_codon:yes gene_type:complete